MKTSSEFVLYLSVLFGFHNYIPVSEEEGREGKESGWWREGRREETEVLLEVKIWELFLIFLYCLRKKKPTINT